jgi:lipopolysaccharide heptosyltransferase II
VTGNPQRLVIRAPNWLGDAVMSLPAMASVRGHIDGTVIIAARPSLAPLFEEQTDARPDEILVVDEKDEIRLLRGARADTIVLLPNSFGSAWAARRSGIAERWGYAASGRSGLLTRAVARPRANVHHVEYYRHLVRGLGIDAFEGPPRLAVTEQTATRADTLLRDAKVRSGERLIGFAPGAAYGHAKRWPPDRVARLIAQLVSVEGVVPVLVGAGDDRVTGREIESSLPAGTRLVNLIGRTTLRTLTGVIARCAAFVSNDSGAMHVAAALGVPLTAIFGPTNERATSPSSRGPVDVILRQVSCRPCMLRECPIDHRCMKRIAVHDVAQSVGRHLAIRMSDSE